MPNLVEDKVRSLLKRGEQFLTCLPEDERWDYCRGRFAGWEVACLAKVEMLERLFQKRLHIGRALVKTNEDVLIFFDIYYRINEPIVAYPSHDFQMVNAADYAALQWMVEEIWMRCEDYVESKRNKCDDVNSVLAAEKWTVV